MPEQNPQPTSNLPKSASPLPKLPRWGWWLLLGLAFVAIFGATTQVMIGQWRASVKTDFPTHQDPLAGWKTFVSQSGWSIRYPNDWTISSCHVCNDPTEKGIFVIFHLPSDVGPVGKGSTIAMSIPVSISISLNLTKKYTNLADLEKETSDHYYNTSWGYSDLGYEQINEIQFFKYSWMHQVQGLKYITLINGNPFVIEFSQGEAYMELEDSKSYPDFLKFLSTFKFLEPFAD